MVLHNQNHVPALPAGLGLFADPIQKGLLDDTRSNMLVAAEAILIGRVFTGVDGDKREPLDWAGHIRQASTIVTALVEFCYSIAIAAILPQVLEFLGCGQSHLAQMLGGSRAEISPVIIVVDIMIAVDDLKARFLSTRFKSRLRFQEKIVHLFVADILTIFGQIATHDNQIGLRLHNLAQRSAQDIRALAEHLAIGVLCALKIAVFAKERVRHIVDIRENGNLIFLGIL